MSDIYFLSYTIGHGGNAEARHEKLLEAVRELTSDAWWTEAPNFLLFNSDESIDRAAAEVAAALHLDTDMALLSRADAQEARAIGAISDSMLFEVMPYAQRYQG